jgi:hypothetical protein
LYQNSIGAKGKVRLGYCDETMHHMNYTLDKSVIGDQPQPFWTFPITQVKFGNYSYPATVKPHPDITPSVPAAISINYPFIMFQSTVAAETGLQGVEDALAIMFDGHLIR